MTKIFISYRRADSQTMTDRLYAELIQVFGIDEVFRDIDAIPWGADFRVEIKKGIRLADVVLVMIGPQWLTVTDEEGVRRLDSPRDVVRTEIEIALNQNDCRVIPILINHTKAPKDDELPDSIKQLAFNNAPRLRDDPDFHNDVERLISRIKPKEIEAEEIPAATSSKVVRRDVQLRLTIFFAAIIGGVFLIVSMAILRWKEEQFHLEQTQTAIALASFTTPTPISTAFATSNVFPTTKLATTQPAPPHPPCSIQQYTIFPNSLTQPVGTILSLVAQGTCVGEVRASRFVIDGTPFGEDAGAKEQSESWKLTLGSHTICFEITMGEWSIGAQRCISVTGTMPTSLSPLPAATFVPLSTLIVTTATRTTDPTRTASATTTPSPTFTNTVTTTLKASDTATYTLTASLTSTPGLALPPTSGGVIRTVAYSADGHYLAVAGDDRLVTLFDLKTGITQTFNGFGKVSSIAFSPDGQYIIVGSDDNSVKRCTVTSASQNGSTCRFLYDAQQTVYSVAYSADGTRIVVGTASGIRVIDPTGLSQPKISPKSIDITTTAVFAADTHTVAFVASDENVHIWDTDTNVLSVLPNNHAVNDKKNRVLAVAYNPMTQQIASGGRAGIVVIQDRAGKLATHCNNDFGKTVTSIAFSPNGRLIAYASGEQVVVCDLLTGGVIRSTVPNMTGINSLVYSSDGSSLLIGGVTNLGSEGQEKGLIQRISAPIP